MKLFDPQATALIAIDMQRSVASHDAAPHSAADVIARIALLADAARQAGGLPVFVRTSFLPDESDAPKRVLDGPGLKPAARVPGWDELLPDMKRRATEPVIIKRSFNAFYGSDLDLQLRRHGIRSVIMAGISTNFGVEGTARGAYDHGYTIIFAGDAMAASTTVMHEASLNNIFPYIGRIRSTGQIVDAFSQ